VVPTRSHPFPSIAIDDLPADIPAILELLADTHTTIALALVGLTARPLRGDRRARTDQEGGPRAG
jgi:hypothetical protein